MPYELTYKKITLCILNSLKLIMWFWICKINQIILIIDQYEEQLEELPVYESLRHFCVRRSLELPWVYCKINFTNVLKDHRWPYDFDINI